MLSKYEAIIITGYTGTMMTDMSSFHKDVESRFGRSVWSHEFGDTAFMEQVRDMYREEFLSLCNTEDK